MSPRRKPARTAAREPNGRLRAVGYTRVSTEEQGQHGVSLAAQRERIEAFCISRDWQLVRIYSDVASGKDLKRPGVQRMLEDARSGAIEAVVIVKLDRLSRRMLDWAQVQAELQRREVALVSIGEGFDDSTPVGRAMSNVVMTFAQMERELIGERTRDALRHKREHLQVYGRTPYGFKRRAERLLPDAKALAVVRGIFDRRKAGASLRQIATALNERGVPSPRGAEWSAEGVRVILRNAALYGQVVNGLFREDETPP